MQYPHHTLENMKNIITSNKQKAKDEDEEEERKKRVEINRAVAQAWLNHPDSWKKTVSEFEARRRYNFIRDKPSRFKLEALSTTLSNPNSHPCNSGWNFGQSLWDSYEIVSVSRTLERGLALDSGSSVMGDYDLDDLKRMLGPKRMKTKKKNTVSLRSLFEKATSSRYNDDAS